MNDGPKLRLGILADFAPDGATLRHLVSLRARFPALAFEVVYGGAAALEAELIAGTMVCASVGEVWPSQFTDFHSLGREPLLAVIQARPGSQRHPAAPFPLIDRSLELAGFVPWAAGLELPGDLAAALAGGRATFVVPDDGSALALALAGGGCALLPQRVCAPYLASGRLESAVSLPVAPSRARHLATRRVNTRRLNESLVIEHFMELGGILTEATAGPGE